jgi:L-alanine-DL-glutamate epimerase-like enolase superfamily enzyme
VYASGGLFLPTTIDGLQSEARAFVEAGFKAMKIRIGGKHWKDDIARVAAVREAIGPDIGLMADANQSLSGIEGMRLGQALEPFGLEWFEEPVVTWNDRDSSAIAAALSTPVASGETEYTRYGIRRMVENSAADIYMPDLQRMGGYSEMRKAVHYLAAHDLPVAPHLFTEHTMHIAASAPNATWCEATDWFEPLFRERSTINANGTVSLPERPGVGFTFDRDGLEKHWIRLKS